MVAGEGSLWRRSDEARGGEDDAGQETRSLKRSLQDYGRSIAGGLVFSLPLLYTMEMWWTGFKATPAMLLSYLLITFFILMGYNRYAGLRPGAGPREVVFESFEETGLGILIAAAALFALGRITTSMPLPEIMGKVVVEAMVVAIGASIGKSQLGSEDDDEESEESDESSHRARRQAGLWGDAVMGVCGAIVIASNVAPTLEILLLAVEVRPSRLLAVALFSLFMITIILFFSGFHGAKTSHYGRTPLLMLGATAFAYTVALIMSAAMLAFFERFDGAALEVAVGQVIILAAPASLGASAGRLLIK